MARSRVSQLKGADLLRGALAAINDAWASDNPFLAVAQALAPVFPTSRVVAHRIFSYEDPGKIGHTLSRQGDDWDALKCWRNIPELANYHAVGPDPFANQAVNTARLFAGNGEHLERTREALLHPNDFHFQLRAAHYRAARFTGLVAVAREESAGEFAPEEVKRLQACIPAIGAAFHVFDLLHQPALSVVELGAAMDSVGKAAMVRTGDGTVIYANRTARHHLSSATAEPNPPEVDGAVLKEVMGESLVLSFPQSPTLAHTAEQTISAQAFAVQHAAKRWDLTRRQAEVLGELVEGRANKEIADKLGCALGTVELHVSAILRKTRCPSRSAVVSAVIKGGTHGA
jgi:DNA-binding CsgD family transcriptional regulator